MTQAGVAKTSEGKNIAGKRVGLAGRIYREDAKGAKSKKWESRAGAHEERTKQAAGASIIKAFMQTPRFRFRFRPWQFRLRTLLVAVALAMALLAGPINRGHRQRAAVEMIRARGGSVEYAKAPRWGSRWGEWTRWAPRDFTHDVVSAYLGASRVTDDDLTLLAGLTRLESLNLVHTYISSDGLARLKPLSTLKHLDLRFTSVSGTAVNDLRRALPGAKIYRWSDVN